MFWPMVSIVTVGASKVVFSFILFPVLVQFYFNCLNVWRLDNIVWETVPVACDLMTKEIVT